MAELEDQLAFPWGGAAGRLLSDYRKECSRGNRLPPYAADQLRQVGEQTAGLLQRAGDMRENPHVDADAQAFQAACLVVTEAALHNRRCARAYAVARREALCDAFWQVGHNLPPRTAGNLSRQEETFLRTYTSLCTQYMEELGAGSLRDYPQAPPPVTDGVLLIGLRDFEFVSASAGEIKVTKGGMLLLSEEDSRPLLAAGAAKVCRTTTER
eukprot:TRINITY_DN14522_c0_g1_i1.p1 TRINITY_DN14522_c0_g1~~TRINITY_DN14522_c0_g1_i1.p1  ORF type:complete len:230 (+),score=100.09 TRINITY_DN14522_c0_g1_i1:56-691(+)